VTESQQRQTLYNYERTILQAFRETEDALITYRKTGAQREAQAARVAAERKVLELAELDEAQTIGAHLVALVRLYKALGGGWPTAPDAVPGSTSQARAATPVPA
jgi:multidrug efflux system outer membrane protein